MKRLSTLQLRPGMIVAEDTQSFDKQLNIAQGTVLTEELITKLDVNGILNVLVEDSMAEGSEAENSASDSKTPSYYERMQQSPAFQKFKADYEQNVSALKEALNNVAEHNAALDVDTLLHGTLDMIAGVNGQFGILDMLQNIQKFDDTTFTHCLNVGLICNVLAKWAKLPADQVELATACGLFHDIGKLMIPADIITKPGKLEPHEFAQMQMHPTLGYQMLQKQNVDDHIRNAALMHHERSDGSGYPMRFSGDQIDPYARIVAIADVYDAMTAARAYRTPLCPFHVIDIFQQEGLQKYDAEYILTFLENVVNSYIQNRCRLSDGREAEIIFINKTKLSRPMVRCGDTYINLADEPNLTIATLL